MEIAGRGTERRIVGGLFAAHSLGSAGIIATATVATLVGADLSGQRALAGVPGAAFQIGAALSALLWGVASDALGRRRGLGLGVLVGAAGAAASALALALGSWAGLLVALAVAGGGSAAVKLGRYAAAEIVPAARRGRALALVVLGGTVGSVLGPNLVDPTAALARGAGLPDLAGAYLATLGAFLAAALVLFGLLRPDPRELGRALAAREDAGAPPRPARALPEVLRDPGVVLAFAAQLLAQGVMVMLMSITSLHMRDHAHDLRAIGLVFSAHTFGMYAVAIVSGRLVDRWGRLAALALGAAVTIAGALSAPLSTARIPLMAALFALGLGWNLSFVAGSTLLSDRLRTAEKGRVQGLADLATGLVSAAASALGGLGLDRLGYDGMGLLGAGLTLLLLPPLLLYPRAVRRADAALATD